MPPQQTTKIVNLQQANVSQLRHLLGVFSKHKDVFPHIRADYVKRRLEACEVVHSEGVWIIYSRYKRRVNLGDVSVPAGSFIIHQIVNEEPGNGKAGKALEQFLLFCEDDDVYLTVRSDNKRARRFYEKNGMKTTGRIFWKSGTLPGHVYALKSDKL